jgi:hypothetical protein
VLAHRPGEERWIVPLLEAVPTRGLGVVPSLGQVGDAVHLTDGDRPVAHHRPEDPVPAPGKAGNELVQTVTVDDDRITDEHGTRL